MTNKIAEFRRINEPRARRALDQIGHIDKSARSMGVVKDMVAILRPIHDRLQEIDPRTVRTPEPPAPPAAKAIEAVGLARKAKGGAAVEHEIRWAIDLIARGDYETAKARLENCL
jgi:hypothetical protein